MNVLCRELQIASGQLRPGCRRKTWGRFRVPPHRPGRRSLHDRRELAYPIEGGVGNFLPQEALRTVVEWQDGLLERLNEQVRGTELAGKPVLQIIADTANKEEFIQTHNYACLAANNSFFLDSIKPPEEGNKNDDSMPFDLKGRLSSQFPGINALKERFVASASGMVSSGWLWLVTDLQGGFAVIPTFGAGTLLVRSRQHWEAVEQEGLVRQSFGYNPGSGRSSSTAAPSSPVSGVKATPSDLNPNTPHRSLSRSAFDNPSVRDLGLSSDISADRRAAHQRGSRLYPLCVLSLFEHTWLSAGLGVWGKEEYVHRFFDVVDWGKVQKIYSTFAPGDKGTSPV